MRWLVSLFLAFQILTFPFAAQAQDVLDRVDPARIGESKIDQLKAKGEDAFRQNFAETKTNGTGGPLQIGAIEIVGLSRLRNADFSDIVQQFIGQTLNGDEVAALVDRLASRARQRFPLASARIAPQTLIAGILRVEIDEGHVDAIELKGFSNSRLEGILRQLITEAPVTAGQLERALLLARDLDGVSIRETRIRRDGERNILVVQGSYDRFRGQLTIDNDTTNPIGPLEVLAFMQGNGVLAHGDSLQGYILAALPEPSELAFARLRYAQRVDRAGTEISIAGSISHSRPGSYLAPFDIVGDSYWASLAVSRPLIRSVRRSVWVDGSFSFRELAQDRSGVPSRQDRLSIARVRMLGSAQVAGGTLHASAAVSQGLDALGATRSGDSMASRSDADGTFTTVQMTGQWSGGIAGPVALALGVRTQLASKPLLVSEEIGLGRARFARGYDYSERSGDQGTMGYVELSYKLDRKVGPFGGLEPYAFVDGGRVDNLHGGAGGGALLSTGAGVRADVDRWTDAAAEIAVPLSGDRYDRGSQAPRIRVSVTRYF